MRADRLVAVLLLLQQRRKLTAAEVAEELEISERTARRDLEALAMAGLPVYSERGRHGGWRLLGGGRTDLSGLNAREAQALFAVAGPQAPASPELKAALRKLVRALPESFRAGAEHAASSVVIDPSAWGRHVPTPVKPTHLGALQDAVAASVQVRLGYRGRDGTQSERLVHPFGLVQKGTVWYLVAARSAVNPGAGDASANVSPDGGASTGSADALRTYRVSRVTSVEPTGDPVERPDGFDLTTTWTEVVERVDRLRNPLEVIVLAEPGYRRLLDWIFEGQTMVGTEVPDGRRRVGVRGDQLESIVGRLAGLGRHVEVVEPPEARDMLARIGAELIATYVTAPRDVRLDALPLTPADELSGLELLPSERPSS